MRKYAAENGYINAIRKFKTDFPKLNKSTIRSFKKKYYKELSHHAKEERHNAYTSTLDKHTDPYY